jgi:hypothetical protein
MNASITVIRESCAAIKNKNGGRPNVTSGTSGTTDIIITAAETMITTITTIKMQK